MMFRFTIRDVLWLTVMVGILCAWWIEHKRASWQQFVLSRDNANLTEALRRKSRDYDMRTHEGEIMGKLLARKQQAIDELRKDRLVRGINEGYRAAHK
jgi:hypothetical protein